MSDLIKKAQAVVDEAFYLGNDTNTVHELRDALSAVGEPASYFFSGKEGSFYASDLKQGEAILKLMNVDAEDWTATELAAPPSVDALIAEIDEVCFDDNSGGYFHRIDICGAELSEILDKYRSAK